ncbi:MAG: response regulator [Terriglobia bacterium]
MSEPSSRRKVLIVEQELPIRSVLFTLLATLGCERNAVASGREALARLSRESFDAVLIDLRCSELPPDEVVSGIHQIRPSLIGHVLVITGEVADEKTLEVVERHLLLKVQQDRLWQDLRGYLRALFRLAPTAHLA